jgi:N-acetylmuramoyl-L-alanine amidase
VRSDDPFIGGVRVGQNQPRVVRLVIDLKQATAPQLFTLAPVAAYQHRLVFDLYPTEERDPLLSLIKDKEQAEQRAAQEVQDALGEFIGKIGRPPDVNIRPLPAHNPKPSRRWPRPRSRTAGRWPPVPRQCRRCRRGASTG